MSRGATPIAQEDQFINSPRNVNQISQVGAQINNSENLTRKAQESRGVMFYRDLGSMESITVFSSSNTSSQMSSAPRDAVMVVQGSNQVSMPES